MRRALGLLFLVAGCAPPQTGGAAMSGPRASVPEQDWAGVIVCDTIPEIVHKELRQRIQLTVRGGVASLDRNVLLPDTSISSGYHEHAQGEVGAGGAVDLAGSGQSRAASYASEYRGTLGADGRARFEGVQHWRFQRHASYDRACRIDLHRLG